MPRDTSMGERISSLLPSGTIESQPAEIYGFGPVILRIGNGGAGATGLIRALAEDYLSTLPQQQSGSISWVCNHSRNTQLALLHDHIDVALTYERNTEAIAEAEGWSRTQGCAFHDSFILAGPSSDPANLTQNPNLSLAQALRRIREMGAGIDNVKGTERVLWHSRNDGSATMWKERSLWEAAGDSRPWEEEKEVHVGENSDGWYFSSDYSPAEALVKADAAGAYLITDRATLLRQTASKTITNTTVFFEPLGVDDVLMNSCYTLLSPPAETPGSFEHRFAFARYMASERGQSIVEGFGVEAGLPLFARVSHGMSGSKLRGGLPRGGKWTARAPDS